MQCTDIFLFCQTSHHFTSIRLITQADLLQGWPTISKRLTPQLVAATHMYEGPHAVAYLALTAIMSTVLPSAVAPVAAPFLAQSVDLATSYRAAAKPTSCAKVHAVGVYVIPCAKLMHAVSGLSEAKQHLSAPGGPKTLAGLVALFGST